MLAAQGGSKMADSVVTPCRLKDLPDDVSQSYLFHKPSKRSKQRANSFSKEAYYKAVYLEKTGDTTFAVKALCNRSQKKNEKPHQVHASFCSAQRKVSEQPWCSYEGG